MNQSVTAFVPGGLPLSSNLGFEAVSVICDNYTSSYLTITDAGKVIPPWTYGAVVALPPGLRWANATLTPTVPAIPGPPVPKSQASLTWTDQQLPADPGHLLQQSAFSNQTLVGTVSAPAGVGLDSAALSVPAGTQSIGYLVRSDAGNDTPQLVQIQGTSTFNDYTDSVPLSNVGGVQWYPFSVTDTAVKVHLVASITNPSSVDILASPLALAVDITNPFGNEVSVIVTNPASGTSVDIDTGPTGLTASLDVSLVHATAAPWQAPGKIARFSLDLSSATTYHVIAAALGKTVYLFDLCYSANAGAAAGGDWQDTAGTPNKVSTDTVQNSAPRPYRFSGAPLPGGSGVGLDFKVNFTAAAFIQGHVTYNQQ